jgi:hypothetical protein
LVPQRNRFSPRLGIAYAPGDHSGLLGKLLGGAGKTSIRAGWGVYMSVIEGNTLAVDEPQPPYGLSYTSPSAPIFAEPFRAAADGSVHVNPFPLHIPPYGITQKNPFTTQDYSAFLPQAGMTAPPPSNTYPYSENYFLSLERGLGANTVLSFSYVGSQAHKLLVVYSANPGNPALCLALSNPAALAPNQIPCGPGGEDSTYVTKAGKVIQGTRMGLGPNFANDDYDATIGNSFYNSFQTELRRSGKGLAFSVSYTYSKSMDMASSMSDVVNPFNPSLNRALSAWDLKHTVVANYRYNLPFDRLTKRWKPLTQGWAISGITRATTGFPVTISIDGDNSLQGSVPNGVNNRFLDTPDFAGGPLQLNSNPRNGQAFFDTSLFSENALGTSGTANRRFFHGPGSFNTDLTLSKNIRFTETKSLEFRFEAFNVFNHAQFFGPTAVNGDFSSNLFGQVVNTAPPRLLQLGAKFLF